MREMLSPLRRCPVRPSQTAASVRIIRPQFYFRFSVMLLLESDSRHNELGAMPGLASKAFGP